MVTIKMSNSRNVMKLKKNPKPSWFFSLIIFKLFWFFWFLYFHSYFYGTIKKADISYHFLFSFQRKQCGKDVFWVSFEKHVMEILWFLVVTKPDRKLLGPYDLSQIILANNIHVLYLSNNKWKHCDVRKYI